MVREVVALSQDQQVGRPRAHLPSDILCGSPCLVLQTESWKPVEILHSQFKVSNLTAWGKKEEGVDRAEGGSAEPPLMEAASSPHTNLCPFLQTPFSIFPLSSPLIAAAMETLWGKSKPGELRDPAGS